jgi:hypothetical protein
VLVLPNHALLSRVIDKQYGKQWGLDDQAGVGLPVRAQLVAVLVAEVPIGNTLRDEVVMEDGIGFIDPVRLDLDSRHPGFLPSRDGVERNPEVPSGNLPPLARKPEPTALIARQCWIEYLGRWEKLQLEEVERVLFALDPSVAGSVESLWESPSDVRSRWSVIEHDGGGC